MVAIVQVSYFNPLRKPDVIEVQTDVLDERLRGFDVINKALEGKGRTYAKIMGWRDNTIDPDYHI